MTPEELLGFIEQGQKLIGYSINPEVSMTHAQEENITLPGDTPEDMQGHYLNTGITIIKGAIELHLKQTRREKESV